jgi:uncharacterized protein YndB with AHSA1/START domain
MRFADDPTVEVDVRIEAPPARVWPFVTDVAVPAGFSSELQGAHWDEGSDGPKVGAKIRGRNFVEGVGEWETTSEVIECDEPNAFAWAVGDASNPSATWRFELTPDADGTILTYRARMGPGPSGLTAAIERIPDKEERIIERRLAHHRENMKATIEGIKRLAESS